MKLFIAAAAVVCLSACTSPTAPAPIDVPMAPAAIAAPIASLTPEPPPPPPPAPVLSQVPACPVSPDDVDHARRLLRTLTAELQRGVEMRFAMTEYRAPFQPSGRELHGRLNYGTAGDTWTMLEAMLAPNTLQFGSAQAAGWALWDAAGQLTITAEIYVNGVKVHGCTPREGKITGRIDLDGL